MEKMQVGLKMMKEQFFGMQIPIHKKNLTRIMQKKVDIVMQVTLTMLIVILCQMETAN